MKKNNANQPRRLAETPESSKDGFWPCTIRYRARASQNDDTLSRHSRLAGEAGPPAGGSLSGNKPGFFLSSRIFF